MIAVVIPTYRARSSILSVLAQIGPEVDKIFVIDDCCPEKTGSLVEEKCTDPRVTVINNPTNQGVGGATLRGYQAAAQHGATVIVKIDADGQMDPTLISDFVKPILSGRADYTKGNRFFNAASLAPMPPIRIFGNAILSLMTKFSTGYWNIFDPSNGYTAIHSSLIPLLPANRIAKRFFFETDILYYLGLLRAVVLDIPIMAHYGDEESNLKIKSILIPFLGAHFARFWRRVALQYFLRDFSFASLCIAVGMPLFLFGLLYGGSNWIVHAIAGTETPTGTIMLATASLLLGIQFLLSFFSADIATVPRHPLHTLLSHHILGAVASCVGIRVARSPV
ncbi:glycosyltransferase family 2 protein [Microvirga arsenatis]|uniref:glycosyltransferase family 2 protein n=1 Tax=Microvirga arsenatis TaxID=2692265 RepID=UPI001FE7CE4C|nr:glycosyltransferase family 2 protein [Microvirga arsenatis]